MTPRPAATDDPELARRVSLLSNYFDVDTILARSATASDIISYYRKSSLGYSLFHSRHGSIHMALNPQGEFDELGYYRAPELVWNALAEQATPGRVLELGSGNGFNLDLIATQAPATTFTGIDLVPQHVRSARRRCAERSNVAVEVGDFQALAYEQRYFAGAYSIESFCHARDPERAFDEIARVLAPRSRFVVVDAWRTGKKANDVATARALKLTEKSMSVSSALTQREWLGMARRAGFRHSRVVPLSHEVLPNLERFERMAIRFMRHKRLARLAGRTIGLRLLENVVAGYLMAESVRLGYHRYDMVVLTRT